GVFTHENPDNDEFEAGGYSLYPFPCDGLREHEHGAAKNPLWRGHRHGRGGGCGRHDRRQGWHRRAFGRGRGRGGRVSVRPVEEKEPLTSSSVVPPERGRAAFMSSGLDSFL